MAKVYAPPADLPPPVFDFRAPVEEYDEACERWIETLKALALGQPGSAKAEPGLIGEVIRFHVADGYAQYLVWQTRPLQLMHLPLLDGYSIPEAHARGLNVEDVKAMVERDRRVNELFCRKEEAMGAR